MYSPRPISLTMASDRSQNVPGSARRRHALGVEEARGDAVGGDHQVLDQLLGAVLLVETQVGEHVVLVHGPRLDGLKAQGAVLVAYVAQRLRDLVLQAQLLGDAGDRRDARGSEAGAVE